MANIFTRKAVGDIMTNEGLTPDQRAEQVFALWGRALDDGYIAKGAAAQAQETAIQAAKADWEKSITTPDPKESDAYKALAKEYGDYKGMMTAINGDDFKDVKPKFRKQVYGMLDRADGAKSVKDQLDTIRGGYEEFFEAAQNPSRPQFGAPLEGSMPKGVGENDKFYQQVMAGWGQ